METKYTLEKNGNTLLTATFKECIDYLKLSLGVSITCNDIYHLGYRLSPCKDC